MKKEVSRDSVLDFFLGMLGTVLVIFVTLAILFLSFGIAKAGQNDLRSIGADYVGRSLNKRVVITPRQSWTEHQPGQTGVDYRVVVCPPTTIGKGSYNEKWKNPQTRSWATAKRNNPFCGNRAY